MEHGREIYKEKKTLKDHMNDSKTWVVNNKERLVLLGLATAGLTTYISYKLFEDESYDCFEDINS